MRFMRVLIAVLAINLFFIGSSLGDGSTVPVVIDLTIEPTNSFHSPETSITMGAPTDGSTTWTHTIVGCTFSSNNPDGFDLTARDETNHGNLVEKTHNWPLTNKLEMQCGGDWESILATATPYVVSLRHFDIGQYTEDIKFQQNVESIDKPGTYESTIDFDVGT